MAALCDNMPPRLIAVGGPTATGKTALAVKLAQHFGGEIISADSMQIYRGLDIGTAKATVEERQGIPHHLVDILPPEQAFSVADFVKAADAAAANIAARGRLPILAGGTGLYITSMINGISFAEEKGDPALRAELARTAAEDGGKAALYAELERIDPAYAAAVHPNNLPRVIRALELYRTTGRKMSEERKRAKPAAPRYDALCLCLGCTDRAELYRRIDARVDKMLAQGMLDEAEYVYNNRESFKTAAQAIGYKELFPYFEGKADLAACTARLKQATRNYAKRQLTWFRNQGSAVWLMVDEPGYAERAVELAENFLNRQPGQ